VQVPPSQSFVATLQSWLAQVVAHCEDVMLPFACSKQHTLPAGQSDASSHSSGCLSSHDGAHAASFQPSLPQQKYSPVQVAPPHATERVLPVFTGGIGPDGASLLQAAMKSRAA
jgi:hypothetical protein